MEDVVVSLLLGFLAVSRRAMERGLFCCNTVCEDLGKIGKVPMRDGSVP